MVDGAGTQREVGIRGLLHSHLAGEAAQRASEGCVLTTVGLTAAPWA